jgi:hypothetical protein
MNTFLRKKGINSRIIFKIFFVLFVANSFAQSTSTDIYVSESKTFDKKPDDVIRSLYLDETGEPSGEIFLRSWGLYPLNTTNEIKPYFTISFSESDIAIKNELLMPGKKTTILNLDFFITSTHRYNSANIAEPIWDGRVYEDENRLIVGGYSSEFNERPVGEINYTGRFVPELTNDYLKKFPILQIPADQVVFDPFKWRLLRLKPNDGDIIEEQKSSFLPVKLYGINGEELKNLRFSLENNDENASVVLYGFIEDNKFKIASCSYTSSKIVSRVDGYMPDLAEGCTQAGNSKIISLTFEGQFSDDVTLNAGALYLNDVNPAESAITAYQHISTNKEEISIDGSFNDWRNIKGVADPRGDYVSYLYPNPDTDILEFKLTNDEQYLYLYTRVAGAHGRTGEKGRYYWYAYIDVDSNPDTGYPPTRDDNCYFGISIGDDCEAQFEFVGKRFVKTFFGFTGIGAEKEVLNGKLKLGPSFYSPTDSDGKQRDRYKVEYVKRDDKRFITHDYTEGTSEDIVIALSPDGSEVEMKVELAGFLKDGSGNMIMSRGMKIDIAVGAEASGDFYESDRWGADSSPIIYGYQLK